MLRGHDLAQHACPLLLLLRQLAVLVLNHCDLAKRPKKTPSRSHCSELEAKTTTTTTGLTTPRNLERT
jgi:hypothetical protein